MKYVLLGKWRICKAEAVFPRVISPFVIWDSLEQVGV